MAIASVSVKSPEKFCRHSDCRSCPMSIRARRLAVVVSWIGHPLVFVTISVGIVLTTQVASRAAIPLLAALFLSLIAPMGFLLFSCSLGSLGRCRCIRPRRTKTFLSDRDSALRSWHNRDVAGECAALHSSRRHDHAPVADSGRNHKLLVQSFAPHFVCDLLHRDSLSCEYILRFGRIDSGRTRVLVATSSFAPHDFRKHQRCRAR